MTQEESGIPAVGEPPGDFAVKDCALIAIATGRRVQTLTELRDALTDIDEDSIFYHFWGGLLHPRFEEREYNNDFASWVRHQLHDGPLAERLAVIDPTEFQDLEALRQELLELIEERLDESPQLPWMRAPRSFEFIRSQIVVFDTHRCIECPEDLPMVVPHMSTSAVFYHFIDARRRSPERQDDFRLWLHGFGDRYAGVLAELDRLDPYFAPLTEVRAKLVTVFRHLPQRGEE